MARQGPATAAALGRRVAARRMQWLLVFLALLLPLRSSAVHAQQQAPDKENYHSAVQYCRDALPRPMALNSERGILCFDGSVDGDIDLSPAKNLKESGLFVVRSFGGYILPAIALSDLLRERRATVVVYDYCLSACASYFFFASVQTYVLEGSLVAWTASAASLAECGENTRPRFLGPPKRPRLPCPEIPDQALAEYKAARSADRRFYAPRRVYRSPELNRDPPHITRLLWDMQNATGVYPDVWWTLNPRDLQKIFKTKIDYEAYPESQAEVDAMVARLHLKKVIYDP
jgi:hypothetical protein